MTTDSSEVGLRETWERDHQALPVSVCGGCIRSRSVMDLARKASKGKSVKNCSRILSSGKAIGRTMFLRMGSGGAGGCERRAACQTGVAPESVNLRPAL